MALVETILARLPGPLVNLGRAWFGRPRPQVRIVGLEPAGGRYSFVDFRVFLANYGTQQCQCEIQAHVDGNAVECQPSELELIPKTPRQRVRILVQRPHLGDLVHQFDNATTLYGRTLRVEAAAGKHKASAEWHEVVYSQEENWQRHNIQQRAWRIGRGEETEADVKSEQFEERMRRRHGKYGSS